jgi:hypothetical protein
MNRLALQPAWTARQRVLAAVTPVGPLLLLAGSLITPSAADDFSPDSKDATKILEAVATDRGRSGLGGILIVIGLMFLVPPLALVVSRVTARGAILATIGGALAMAAMAAGSLTNTFFFTSYALTDPDLTVKVGDLGPAYGGLGPVLVPFFIAYLAGSLLGFILLAIAVFRSGQAPKWAAVMLGLAGLAIVAVDAGSLGGVIVSLALLISLIGCGVLATHRGPAATDATSA